MHQYEDWPAPQRLRICLRDYKDYFFARLKGSPEFRRRVLALRGKTLGCFCAPPGGFKPGTVVKCHGQIMAAWIDAQPEEGAE